MRVIPAIDLLDGKCVRLFKGDYNQVEIFNDQPVELAKEMEQAGLEYLHLVDLDGARSSGTNQHILTEIANNTSLQIDFGGGLRTYEDVKTALENGASQVNIGSMAIKEKTTFIKCLQDFGDKIIWNADLKDGNLAIHGWQETVDIEFNALLLEFIAEGLKWVLSTDVSKDGTLEGPNTPFYKKMILSYPEVNWVASGGVSTKEDLVMLKRSGLAGAVVGKAFYKGTITYEDLLSIE
ncbi:MAG: 1-(5-phosphoribosyl)-5-[(5-phosphoribosylamino)methylideneamino]imidazole-4-carboxamide isomerase [Candidatus Cyclobacteriaceae bacterium M2_1C_046]